MKHVLCLSVQAMKRVIPQLYSSAS